MAFGSSTPEGIAWIERHFPGGRWIEASDSPWYVPGPIAFRGNLTMQCDTCHGNLPDTARPHLFDAGASERLCDDCQAATTKPSIDDVPF